MLTRIWEFLLPRLKGNPSWDFLAQGWHCTMGAFLVLWFFVMWGKVGAILAAVAVYCYLIPKEFWWDLKYEEGQSIGIGFKDIAYWTAGILIAFLTLYWKGAL